MIVDDHQMMIDGVKSLLRKEKNMVFKSEANSAEKAIELIRQDSDYDLIISDLSMIGLNGLELTKFIKKDYPHIKVLILTMHNDPAVVQEIINSDAEGYILKNTGKQELTSAINKIIDGGTFYSSDVMRTLLHKMNKSSKIETNKAILSERETEIVKLIVKEYSTIQIADLLCISPRTVDTHRKNILHKLDVKTVVGLIKFAYENDLCED